MNEEMKQQVLSKLLEVMIDPDSLPETINEYTEKAKPLIRATGKAVLDIYEEVASNDRYPKIRAMSAKKTYDAFVNVGFTDDQALALMINDNIQLMKNIKESGMRASKNINKK
jgi:methylmalonyl-CoA mutase N-terminal domain/subunit